jgi:hypothetical protein
MRLERDVTRLGEIRSDCKTLVTKPQRKMRLWGLRRRLEDLQILEQGLSKFICHEIVPITGFCERGSRHFVPK